MNWYKRARYFNLDTENDDGQFTEQTGIDIYDAAEQAETVFTNNDINYGRQKQITEVVMPDDEDKIVGALATGWNKSGEEYNGKEIYEYSFDLSVLKNYQKKGAGRQLISNAIQKYETEKADYQEMGYYTRIKVWAVNENVKNILENEYGFDCQPVAHHGEKETQWMCYQY